MNLTLPKQLADAVPVVAALEENGFEAVFVGGAVRDTVIGLPVKDVDIATSALPEQVMEMFPKCIPTGLQHGTITVVHEGETYEVTTYRQESAYENYRKPSDVTYITSLEGDLLRRDFTMNAMALTRSGGLLDPYNGLGDIEARCVRCVGDAEARFQEDALRMLRAVRFAAVYGYRPSVPTWRSLKRHRRLLRHIAMERVQAELDKMLAANDPLRALSWLYASRLIDEVKDSLPIALPDDETVRSIKRSNRFTHLRSLRDLDCRWAAVFIMIGVSPEQADDSLRLLKLSNSRRHKITALVRIDAEAISAGAQASCREDTNETLRQWWLKAIVREGKELADNWLNITESLRFGEDADQLPAAALLRKLLAGIEVCTLKQLDVNGRHLSQRLGRAPGPWVSAMLNRLLLMAADGALPNERERLLAQAELWYKEDKTYE